MSTASLAHPIDHIGEHKKFRAFILLAFFMAAITGIELVIIFLPLSDFIMITGIILLSMVKFFGVILWFMHLYYDRAGLFIVFFCALMMASGTVIALVYLFSPEDVLLEEVHYMNKAGTALNASVNNI